MSDAEEPKWDELRKVIASKFPLDAKSMELAKTLTEHPGIDYADATALFFLAAAHCMARYTDVLDLGARLLEEDREKAVDFVASALDAAHWLTPNAGERSLDGEDDPEK